METTKEPVTNAYVVCFWGSHPDADNDDCATAVDGLSLEQAQSIFNAADPRVRAQEVLKENDPTYDFPFAQYFSSCPFVELDGPDRNEVRQWKTLPKRRAHADGWRREIAMEAGMCLGVDAYNDAMGY